MGAGLGSISYVASATQTNHKTLTPSLILINFPPPATGAWFSCRALWVRPQLPFNMMSFSFWLPEPRREEEGERKKGKTQLEITELRNVNWAVMKSTRRERWRVAARIFNQSGQIEGCRREVCGIGSHNGINGGGREAESSFNRNRVSGGGKYQPDHD